MRYISKNGQGGTSAHDLLDVFDASKILCALSLFSTWRIFCANRQKSRNASYLLAANFFASQF